MRAIDADALDEVVTRLNVEENRGITRSEYKLIDRVLFEFPTIEPQRKTGKWILVKGSNGKDYHKCSECLHTQEITGVKNYCAVCGAEMRGTEDIPMEYFESGGR